MFFLFSSQLNAITPEQFEDSFDQWSRQHGLIDGYQLYLHGVSSPNNRFQQIKPLIKNVFNLFKEDQDLLEILNPPNLQALFIFLDTVICQLVQKHSNDSLILLEDTNPDDIFTAADISALTAVLLLSNKKEDVLSLANIFCEKIVAFMTIQFTDLARERFAFLAEIIEHLSPEIRMLVLDNLELGQEEKLKVELQLSLLELKRKKVLFIDSLSPDFFNQVHGILL